MLGVHCNPSENLLLAFSVDVDPVLSSCSTSTAPARGAGMAGGAEAGADGLGTPAGHSLAQGGT